MYLATSFFCFFFNDTATTEIYTLSLHDALSIFIEKLQQRSLLNYTLSGWWFIDRKSTRLNSSHLGISYAVFCLKKKYKITTDSQFCVKGLNRVPTASPVPVR